MRVFDSGNTSEAVLAPRLSLGELLDGVRDGRSVHIGELRRRFGDALYAAVYHLAPSQASEVVDDVFLKLPELIDSYEDRGKFEAWLHRIAQNLARTAGRSDRMHEGRVADLDAADRSSGRSATAGRSVEQGQLRSQLLGTLDDRQRKVWELHEAGFRHQEIAAQLSISVSNSEQILRRARLALQEEYHRLFSSTSPSVKGGSGRADIRRGRS